MCCGNSRIPFRPGGAGRTPQAASPMPAAGTFENIGRTGVTVVGPATGRRYHFRGPGSRLAVDPRDRASVAEIAQLRALGPRR